MHENHELCSLVSFKSHSCLLWCTITSNYVMKMIHRKIHCSVILMSNDDNDNDDVIEAKSPVRKSKRDKKPTKRESFIYDYDKI